MKKLAFILLGSVLFINCRKTQNDVKPEGQNKFSFVFMTDIHVMPELKADSGLMQAIDMINELAPGFVITGGDNIMDALGQTWGRSDSLYNLYKGIMGTLEMPVYHTLGNHEVFGLYKESGIDPGHEEYGKKMYENRLETKPYYSFDQNNWHFIVLDGIGYTADRQYYGVIDSAQVEWLKRDLEKTGQSKPVVIITHIPMLSVGAQIMEGPTAGLGKSTVITNAREIIKILEQYNVKLVLQGHLHFLEDIQYNRIRYITGGAVSAGWWNGPRNGMEEGFVKVEITGEDFTWQYVDFGWEVQ